MELGKRLEEWRLRRNLSIKKVSELTGLSSPYISQLEHSTKALKSVETLVKLAKVYNVPVDLLVKKDEEALHFFIIECREYFYGEMYRFVSLYNGTRGTWGTNDIAVAQGRMHELLIRASWNFNK